MKILLTGADRPLGGVLCRSLAAKYEIAAVGEAEETGEELGGCSYRSTDLCDPANVKDILDGVERIVHTQPFDPLVGTGVQAEQELLDRSARGTYVLAMAAVEAQIERLVLVSQIALMQDYPDDYIVAETWAPLPRAEAESLAPYMAELVGREIARQGQLEVVCLRFGSLGAADGTAVEDAATAVADALTREEPGRGHSWGLHHVVSGGRFAR